MDQKQWGRNVVLVDDVQRILEEEVLNPICAILTLGGPEVAHEIDGVSGLIDRSEERFAATRNNDGVAVLVLGPVVHGVVHVAEERVEAARGRRRPLFLPGET